MQRYGGNSFANFFRGEGVLYKEILCDVCDHLKVNYNESSNTSLIEENMLAKILKDSLEQMSKKDLEELCHELGMTNINKMIGENKQVLVASVLTLFKTGGSSHSYPLVIAVANAMVKKTLGHGLTAVAGKVVLKKISGILAGPIGWAITGVLVSINLAGPAYRVTVPACFVVAALRRKPKQINKAKTDNNKGGKGIFIFIFLVILVIFSPIIFFKREHQPNNNASNNQESGVKKLKNPSHKN
ncbi:hypothetical protein HpHA15_01280 [Helicobacter pylori]